MKFTPLHQAIGAQPGPITSEMIDDLVAQGVEESDNIDFKKELPAQKDLAKSDFPKDVAAFANGTGGVLVFGVAEESRKASGRVPVDLVGEAYERTLRQVAVSAIHPPVFGLQVVQVGDDADRVLIVDVPPSVERPHLIYRNDYFGAPLRNHADTIWMRERQIEQMYRSRLESRTQIDHAVDELYEEAALGRETSDRAWLIAVALPRLPRASTRPELSLIRSVVESAKRLAPRIASDEWVHPLNSVDALNPRRGMRRWVLPNVRTSDHSRWRSAWISILDNGSVTLAMSVGGYPELPAGDHVPGGEVSGRTIECCVTDLIALVAEVSAATGPHGEYDLRLGVEWTGDQQLLVTTFDTHNFRYTDSSIPLARFTPIRVGVQPDTDERGLQRQAHDIALDAVNQGGVQHLQMIADPDV